VNKDFHYGLYIPGTVLTFLDFIVCTAYFDIVILCNLAR